MSFAKTNLKLLYDFLRISTVVSKTRLLLYSILFDLLFIISYYIVQNSIRLKIVEYFYAITTTVAQQSGQITRDIMDKQSIFSAMQSNPVLSNYLNTFLLLLLLQLLSIFVVYCFFQGICWYLSYKALGEKVNLNKLLRRFIIVNIPVFIILVIQQLISLFIDFNMTVAERKDIAFERTYSSAPLIIIIVTVYFAFIAYSLLGKYSAIKSMKKALYIGIVRFYRMIPCYLAVIVVFWVIDFVLKLLFRISYQLSIIIGVLVLFVLLFWTRIMVKDCVDSY